MSNGKTFAEFAKLKIGDKNEELPEHVRVATGHLIEFEERYGTEATQKLVEKTVSEEVSGPNSDDRGYVEYLAEFLSDMKRHFGEKSN